MTATEIRSLQKRVLELLARRGRPSTTTELLRDQRRGQEISPESLRRAVWQLVGDGKISYTNDRRIRLVEVREKP